MANRSLIRSLILLVLLAAAIGLAIMGLAQSPTATPRSSPPTGGIMPITNGKLLTPLDANSFQILNLDTSNLPSGGGGGGGGLTSITGDSGAATGLTLSITHTTGSNLTDPIFTLGATLSAAHGGTGLTSLAALKSGLSLDNVDNTSDANKPISTATATALGLKADSSAVTSALALKADTTALALKENLLPTTSVNGYILSRNTTGAYSWVDPVTLGTTSYNGTDGVSNTTTTYTSATANFVPSDVGLTITGTDIPAATTIASRTNSTTIVLSQAATGSHTGNSFTIVNRLLPAGGTGTVTTFSAGNLATLAGSPATLFTTAVGNAGTTPSLSFTMTTAPVNTFFGNSGSGVGYFDAPTALNVLGATTVGTKFLSAISPNPASGLFVFPRVGNTNAVDFRTPAQLLGDLGAENALSFSPTPPFSRSGNTITLAQATATTSGWLSSTDWGTFNNKVPTSRTLVTTAPLRISTSTTPISGAPGSDFSANRTIDMPPSTNSVDGYLSAADHAAFAGKAPADSEVTFTGGTSSTPATWTSGATAAKENAGLSATAYALLPPANAYQAGKVIYYYDDKTTANAGRQFRPQGSTDTLNGQNLTAWGASWYAPFIAGATSFAARSISFKTNGSNAWVSLGNGVVDHVEDPADASKRFVFDASQQAGSPAPVLGHVKAAAGDSVTVTPTDNTTKGVVTDVNVDGTVSKSQLHKLDVLPREFRIGTEGSNIAANAAFTVDSLANGGLYDTVRIAGTLTGPIIVVWPDAGDYNVSETLTLDDSSGSVSTTNPVIISTNVSNHFNSGFTFLIDEQWARKAFTSNNKTGTLGVWSVPTNKTSVQPFAVIPDSGNQTFIVQGNTVAVKHNGQINLGNGINTLSVANPYDGMEIELFLKQPASGARGTLNLPQVSRVEPAGAGVVTLTDGSSTPGAIDKLRGAYSGTLNAYMWDAPKLIYSAIATPTAPTAGTANPVSATEVDVTWTDHASTETGFEIQRAIGAGGFSAIATATPVPSTGGTGTYVDTNVTAVTTYHYKVRAFNSGGNSGFTTNMDAVTPSGAPSAEIWQLPLNEGSNTVVGSLVPPNGVMNLAKWAASGSGFGFAPTKGLNAVTGVSVTTTGTTGTSTYRYRIVPWDDAGETLHGAGFDTTAITTGNAVLDTANFNNITWNTNGADHYSVYRLSVGGNTSPTDLGKLAGTITCSTTCTVTDKGEANIGTTLAPNANDISFIKSGATGTTSINYGSGVNVITITFWVKSALNPTPSSAAKIIDLGNSGPANVITLLAGNKIEVREAGTSGTLAGTVPTTGGATTINDNTTSHLVTIVMDNSTLGNTPSTLIASSGDTDNLRVYFDDHVRQTMTFTANARVGAVANFPSNILVIGSTNFAGLIDDFRVYNHAIDKVSGVTDTSAIHALYTGGPQ